MSTSEPRMPGREIARALEQTLDHAMANGASWEAVSAARNAAQLLSLPGLDQLMSLLELGVEPRSDALGRAFHQLRSYLAECVQAGNLLPLQSADAELGGMAVHLLAQTPGISASAMSDPETAMRLGDVLEDMPVRSEDLADLGRRVRLAAPVAAALRAAVDWLAGDEPANPLRLVVEDGTLEVGFDQVNPLGLASAHHVLSSVGGNFGPAAPGSGPAGARGRWIVRVPTLGARGCFLMLVQGTVQLALPWHAVLRVHMIRQSEIESGIRLVQAILDPIAPLEFDALECPVVLLGHGAKRAYLVADRLVWRMAADVVPVAEGSPDPRLASAVQSDDGEVYWVVDPGRMLERIEDPVLIEMERTARREGTMLPTLGPDDVEPIREEIVPEAPARTGTDPVVATPPTPTASEPGLPDTSAPSVTRVTPPPAVSNEGIPPPTPAPASQAHHAASKAPPHSSHSDTESSASIAPPSIAVQPRELARPEATVPPAHSARGTVAAATASPTPIPVQQATIIPVTASSSSRPSRPTEHRAARPGARKVLIAEDSIAARVFLTKLFEQRGWEVKGVATATELLAELYDESWTLVCSHVELPDGRGVPFLKALRRRQAEIGASVPIVALVRDGADTEIAHVAGLEHTILKPFERDALDHLLVRLGLAPEGPHGD